jgi:hypothetical protein
VTIGIGSQGEVLGSIGHDGPSVVTPATPDPAAGVGTGNFAVATSRLVTTFAPELPPPHAESNTNAAPTSTLDNPDNLGRHASNRSILEEHFDRRP